MITRVPTRPDSPYPLGRNVNHDERSRGYPYRATRAPYSAVHTRRVPVLDQGAIGACTGFAGTYALGTDPSHGKLSATVRDSLSAEYALSLYSAATKVDPFQGTWPPSDTGSDGLSICKVLKSRGIIDRYEWAFTTNDVLVALSEQPVMIGIPWYDSMFYPDSNGVITVEEGSIAFGGHEITLNGIDVATRMVSFTNSWGTSWGNNGNGYMSWDTLDALLNDPAIPGDCVVPKVAGRTESWWDRLWRSLFG